jgi:Icc protein
VKTNTLIAQLSDCHLPADPQQRYRGINPYQNLQTLLQKVQDIEPDLVLASGDLSEDGSRQSYQALRQLLEPLDVPVLALPGNHDDSGLLAEIFPDSPTDTIRVSEHGPWQLVRLNSSLPGKVDGCLSEKTVSELEHHLRNERQRPRLIALHHQPIPVGSPWIDKYPLLEPQAFLKIIDRHPDIKAVVWGHVHQAFAADRKGTSMLGGPSSAINSLPGVQKFTADPNAPSCRIMDLQPDGTFRTYLI